MLSFEPISLAHRDEALRFLCCKNAIHTESSFNALYAWGIIYNTQLCFSEGFMFIRSGTEGKRYYQVPRGDGDISRALDLIREDAEKDGFEPRLISVTQCMRERLETVAPGVFEFREARDSFDYIYSSKDLIELAGRAFHQKRNNVNKFKKLLEGRYEYQAFTARDIPEVMEFQHEWLEKNMTDENRESLLGEMRVIERIFNDFDTLGYVGGMIRVDGKVAAYTAGSRLCSDAFLISLEKADIQYPGIYQAINQFYAAENCRDVRYINREDDAGAPGLRKAKLSYNPEILLAKYHALWRE